MLSSRLYAIAISIIVAATVIAGFFVIGSPREERLRRFDDQRVMDLQNLQSQIVSFWQSKNRLPQNLDELRNEIIEFIPPHDPETGVPYEYRVVSPLSFELCATFSRPSDDAVSLKGIPAPTRPEFVGSPGETWQHGVGRVCFSRTIDPEIFGRKELPARPLD